MLTKTNEQTHALALEIKTAQRDAERERIFQFRYTIYAEEMEKSAANIDFTKKLITDAMDENSILIYALDGERIVGTARVNVGTRADFPPEIENFYKISRFEAPYPPDQTVKFIFITKLMVAKEYRGTPVLYLMMGACYDIFIKENVQFGFGACSFHLIRFYEQMGFHRYSDNFMDGGYGTLCPIVMLADDVGHFRALRSPLYRLARRKQTTDDTTRQWFYRDIFKPALYLNSQTTTAAELWSTITDKLSGDPLEKIPLIRGLSTDEAKFFLHACACIVTAQTGERITQLGDESYALYLLLSGSLRSLTFVNPTLSYRLPGSHFGANGLTEHNKHQDSIMTQCACEILVLTGLAFQKLRITQPELAHKIIRNVQSLPNTVTTLG